MEIPYLQSQMHTNGMLKVQLVKSLCVKVWYAICYPLEMFMSF